jgi:hypothetical protein
MVSTADARGLVLGIIDLAARLETPEYLLERTESDLGWKLHLEPPSTAPSMQFMPL